MKAKIESVAKSVSRGLMFGALALIAVGAVLLVWLPGRHDTGNRSDQVHAKNVSTTVQPNPAHSSTTGQTRIVNSAERSRQDEAPPSRTTTQDRNASMSAWYPHYSEVDSAPQR